MDDLIVGDVVTVKRASGVNAADARAIVVERYTLTEHYRQRPGWTLLFEDGRADGFSPEDLELFGVVKVDHVLALAGYRFRSMSHLARDHRAGVFAMVWSAPLFGRRP